LGFPIERVFDRNEVAEIVGQGGGVIERIFQGEQLTRVIQRDRGGFIQGIGDGGQIALGVIPKGRRVAQRIGDGGTKSSNDPISFSSTSEFHSDPAQIVGANLDL
jgi:hypothetical protein